MVNKSEFRFRFEGGAETDGDDSVQAKRLKRRWPTEDNYKQEHKSWIAINDPSSFPSFEQQLERNDSLPSSVINNDPAIVKKLSHNASERDRRKKLNNLFSSLRSILPGIDQTRKLSIPATVSRVLKYIPELQKQVERLKQRKGEILASVYNRGNNKQRNSIVRKSLPTVSVSRVDEKDILIQICTSKNTRRPFSEVLMNLEYEGLQVLDVSVFGSSGEVVFFNLHLQVNLLLLYL
ncbi:transcription factor ORG2-like [Telopea speciosissima]|uniref:transcription factor ORG2-like n=1 Tax=Telopea speciosissima TaxID=54955 RepID=UPI001CC7B14C|nr:transcription factor ORG2-like [Telopea speciosissima]